MFGIGMQELMIILLVALVVIGPKKLPEVARTLAKGMRELRKASDDLRHSIMVDVDDPPPRSRYSAQPPKQLPPRETAARDDEAKDSERSGNDDDDGPGPQITGSLVAGAPGTVSRETVLDSAPESSAPESSASESSASESSASESSGPDPMDANDHSGMPYGPGSAELDDLLAKAKARQARDTHRRATGEESDPA